jgi:antitoxin component YwqK of YwqJK toxin-antitoxin module
MMKISTFSIIISTLLLFSCTREYRVAEETYPDGSEKRVIVYRGKGENREMIRETTYYPNKQVQMDGTYKDNKREGKWMYWYENGKPWSEGFFKNGKSDGKRITYFENGKVRYEGIYKEDMRVGKWRFFDESGRLLQEVDYSAPPAEGKKQ